MNFKGKYIIYESNIKGKEYDSNNDELSYEGEYLNDEGNGKGKEYYSGILIYEGYFLNDEGNGKGKEYFNIVIHVDIRIGKKLMIKLFLTKIRILMFKKNKICDNNKITVLSIYQY